MYAYAALQGSPHSAFTLIEAAKLELVEILKHSLRVVMGQCYVDSVNRSPFIVNYFVPPHADVFMRACPSSRGDHTVISGISMLYVTLQILRNFSVCNSPYEELVHSVIRNYEFGEPTPDLVDHDVATFHEHFTSMQNEVAAIAKLYPSLDPKAEKAPQRGFAAGLQSASQLDLAHRSVSHSAPK